MSEALHARINYYTPEQRLTPDARPDFNALPLQNWDAEVHDLRTSAPTSMDAEGFRFLETQSAVRNFHDLEEVDAVYIEEMKELVREVTGATETRIAGRPGLRSSAPAAERGASMMTGSFVHADVSAKGAQQYLDLYLPDEAERWRQHRFGIFNVWRSFSEAPQDWPLGLCDTRSVSADDKQLCDITLQTRGKGQLEWETQAYVNSPRHKWFYASEMRRDEALLFRTFDSDPDHSEPVPHAAFVNPTVPAGVPPRESVEIRIFALFEN